MKLEISPKVGTMGKINVKFYAANKQGQATIMITKTNDSEFDHVKVFVFEVIMYLLDGLIDKEITTLALENMKVCSDKISNEGDLTCKICSKTFKTKTGLAIHMSKGHENASAIEFKDKNSRCIHGDEYCAICAKADTDVSVLKNHMKESDDIKCNSCDFSSQDKDAIKRHMRDTHGNSFESISPKQKKMKKSEDASEDMDSSVVIEESLQVQPAVDDVCYWVDARESTEFH